MTDQDEANYLECIAAFKRAKNNAVFFIEQYWNIAHPDKALVLTDEEREELFHRYKTRIPLFSEGDSIAEYHKWLDELHAKGLKDWEIF